MARRWPALIAIATLTMSGFQAVNAAQATPQGTPAITVGGAAATATIGAHNAKAKLSFTTTKKATLVVTFLSWTFPADGATTVYLTNSSGKLIRDLAPLDGSGPWSLAPFPISPGSYDLVVDTGHSGDTGSVTVQLSRTGSIEVGAKPVPVSIGKAEQPVLLAFKAAGGTTVVAGAAGSTFGYLTGASLGIEDSGGATLGLANYLGASPSPVYTEATLPETGTYFLTLLPAGAGSTGKANLTLRTVRAPGEVTIGGPAVTVSTKTPGASAAASFQGSAGESIAIVVHSTTFTGDTGRIYVAGANGVPVGPAQYLSATGAVDGPVILPRKGHYTVVVTPGLIWSAGSATFSLTKVTDVHLTTTIGGSPVTAVIKHPAQRAFVTFTGKANEQVTVAYSGSTFKQSTDTIALDGPGNTVVAGPAALTGASGALSSATLPKAGTYTVVIDPSFDGDTGRVSVSVTKTTAASAARPASELHRKPPPPLPVPPASAASAPSENPAQTATGNDPSFTITYNYSSTGVFWDGGPYPGGQGYYDTSTSEGTWTGETNGKVTGSGSATGTGHNWLYDDVCIIAEVSDSGAGGQSSGTLPADEVSLYQSPGNSMSYTIYPATITATGTGSSESRSYLGGACGQSSSSNSSGPWQAAISLGELSGSIQPGQISSSGHSACGTGDSSGSIIGGAWGDTNCSLDWKITNAYNFILSPSLKSPSAWKKILNAPHHDHPSIDIPVPVGTPFYAITAGSITDFDTDTCGNGIQINGTDGVQYVYCHASERDVKTGQKVTAGTQLGLTGESGEGLTGPHLHFQINYPIKPHTVRCPQTLLWALYTNAQPPPDASFVKSLPTSKKPGTTCIEPKK